jgi:hypothetical protein
VSPEDLARLDSFPRSYEIDTDVDLPGGSGGERVHYVPADASGVGRDGALLRLRPEGGAAWLGMFAGCVHVSACPHPFHLLVWGDYDWDPLVGDVRDPRSFRTWRGLAGPLRYLLAAPAARRLIGVSWETFVALGPDGPAWERKDNDLHYLHTVRLEGDVLRVVAESPPGPW